VIPKTLIVIGHTQRLLRVTSHGCSTPVYFSVHYSPLLIQPEVARQLIFTLAGKIVSTLLHNARTFTSRYLIVPQEVLRFAA